jgi:hypothetical protein
MQLQVFSEEQHQLLKSYPCSQWIELLPEEIPFHTTHPVKLCLDDEEALYRQLVCWWLMQQFASFVLKQLRFKPWEIETIRVIIEELEHGNSSLQNSYSPTKFQPTHNPMIYPPYIRNP